MRRHVKGTFLGLDDNDRSDECDSGTNDAQVKAVHFEGRHCVFRSRHVKELGNRKNVCKNQGLLPVGLHHRLLGFGVFWHGCFGKLTVKGDAYLMIAGLVEPVIFLLVLARFTLVIFLFVNQGFVNLLFHSLNFIINMTIR